MIVWLLVWVIVFSMWPLGPVMIYILAMRTSAPRPWRAFVPIADVFLIARMGRKYSISTVISGLLLPLWGTFLWFCYWSDIAEEMRKPGWLGFLMLVPGLNILALAYITFSKREVPIGRTDSDWKRCPDCEGKIYATNAFCSICKYDGKDWLRPTSGLWPRGAIAAPVSSRH